MRPGLKAIPELLAPAGDPDSLRAALHGGADAVYLGLDEGFNCRARAANFPLANLPAIVRQVHRAKAQVFVTMNTLVFEEELPRVGYLIREVVSAGVDAIIVQDPAVAVLAQQICPELPVHASTQMTISSSEGMRWAESLGVRRVVLPRELSLEEVGVIAKSSDLELEVFVHGALCVAYSGQCLTSEAWGQRSANRGQCAQSCRLSYDLIVDGEVRPLGEVKYLMSPKDQAAVEVLPELHELGVQSLKIEGRQKGAHYVKTAVGLYRAALDAADSNRERLLESASLAYTRGFGLGFHRGIDHQHLVEGRFPKHRGLLLGHVIDVMGSTVSVRKADRNALSSGGLGVGLDPGALDEGAPSGEAAPRLEPGMGIVFDQGNPESKSEPGGPLFRVHESVDGWRLGFGQPGPDLSRVQDGDRVWVTGDHRAQQATQSLISGSEPLGRWPLLLQASGGLGEPLQIHGSSGEWEVHAESPMNLEVSKGEGLTREVLHRKLGAVGGTIFHLAEFDSSGVAPGLTIPVSQLKRLRRQVTDSLTAKIERGPVRTPQPKQNLSPALVAARLPNTGTGSTPSLIPLCREMEQLEAVIRSGIKQVELDWMELVGLEKAVDRARQSGLEVHIATVRIQKPGEESYDQRIARLQPDGVLVRHWGGVMHFSSERHRSVEVHGDFALNVTNSMTAHRLLESGLQTLTASHDLDWRQLESLLQSTDAGRVTVVAHHRIPTFHNEHCVYAHVLSFGRDYLTCGRPCEQHRVSIRDQQGREHPVIVDVGCRNTVFHHEPQSVAERIPALLDLGVRRFRIEFVREGEDEAFEVLQAYQRLLSGDLLPGDLLTSLGVRPQTGVSPGAMEFLV